MNFPKNKVWRIVDDPVKYHEIAPNIGEIEMIAEGRRRCYNAKIDQYWEEDMVDVIDGTQFAMHVDTNSMRDLKGNQVSYPLKSMNGIWKVTKLDNENKSEILMQFDYEMKYGIIGKFLHF